MHCMLTPFQKVSQDIFMCFYGSQQKEVQIQEMLVL